MKRGIKLVLLALGVALFAWFVHRAGWREILSAFQRLGWWLPVALLPYFLVYLLDTLGWWLAFGPDGVKPAFLVLLRVRWAGEALNSVVPTGYVGGEAMKAFLLHKRGFHGLSATTSVVVSKTVQVTAQVLFIALGAWLAWLHLPVGSGARRGMAVVAILAVVTVLGLFWVQRHGMFRVAGALAGRLRIRSLEQRQAQLRELDDRVFGFYHRSPGAFAASGLAYFAGWLADALELFIVSRLLGFPLDYTEAIAIESFISVAKALGIFVPGALGVQESGVWLLFSLFGLSEPQAGAYAVLRRGREVIYAAIGALLLHAEGPSEGVADR